MRSYYQDIEEFNNKTIVIDEHTFYKLDDLTPHFKDKFSKTCMKLCEAMGAETFDRFLLEYPRKTETVAQYKERILKERRKKLLDNIKEQISFLELKLNKSKDE